MRRLALHGRRRIPRGQRDVVAARRARRRLPPLLGVDLVHRRRRTLPDRLAAFPLTVVALVVLPAGCPCRIHPASVNLLTATCIAARFVGLPSSSRYPRTVVAAAGLDDME